MFTVKTRMSDPEYFEKLKKNIKKLREKKVVAGFPKGKLNAPHYENSDKADKPSIIDVAIWNNFGIGVPRRDFMTPSSKRWNEKIQEYVDELGTDLVDGKIDADKFLDFIGQIGAEIISDEIIKLDTPPNAPETIARKKSSNPLVDTGDMARAPRWEIRNSV